MNLSFSTVQIPYIDVLVGYFASDNMYNFIFLSPCTYLGGVLHSPRLCFAGIFEQSLNFKSPYF